jgi:hypothetical protein
MNATYECLNSQQCARLLTRYEALKREQARIQSGLGVRAWEAGEIVAQVAESRRTYTQHWAIHRAAHMSSSNASLILNPRS